MKLSLAWIFDHIDADLSRQNIDEIVAKFNEVSAEIDGVHHITYNLETMFVGQIKEATATDINVFIPEQNISAKLPLRDDITQNSTHPAEHVYVIKKTSEGFDWVTHVDFKQERATPVPVLSLSVEHHKGSWRSLVSTTDTILDVDNKTITHRPDMWGHRGFAREIAAFMNLPLKDTSSLLVDLEKISTNEKSQFSCKVETPHCKRFTLAHISHIKNAPSDFKMAFRLMRAGMRVFSAIVDLTNYVMLDWAQPMHAYDATKVPQNTFIVRNARPDEEFVLLDGTTRQLSESDILIATPTTSLCLGGIKGGRDSGITSNTSSVALEAGNFDATTIRKTAFKLNLRTEAAARFEKTPSTEQTREAIARFLYLANSIGLEPKVSGAIIDIQAQPYQTKIIKLLHKDIESKMGITLAHEQIVSYLDKLGFKVTRSASSPESMLYEIEVPHWRASKDVAIAEDIIEEIARMYGFNSIPLSLPVRSTPPPAMTHLIHERHIKRLLAQSGMIEQKNYMYYDKRFTDQLKLDTSTCLSIINPVSDNLSLLASSLVPGLLKNIEDNVNEYDDLSFFEINATWEPKENAHLEKQRLAGIFFSRRSTVDFFEKKNICSQLFELANLHDIIWKTDAIPQHPWLDTNRTATVWNGTTPCGYAGFVKTEFLQQLTGILPESSALIFDFDYELLKNPINHIVKFKSLSKYQASYFDVSMLVPANVSYKFITDNLSTIDTSLAEVRLLDSFTKKDWIGKRSLTFRCKILDHQRTMTRDEIDVVYAKVVSFANEHQLVIRE